MSAPVAIVTGAASGIGAACADRLARDGYVVYAAGLGEAGLADVAARIGAAGGEAHAVPLDVTDDAARDALFAEIESRHGRVDVLVNSAAMLGRATNVPAIDETLDHFRKVLEVNLVAVFAWSQAAARIMRKRGSGVIVHVSSVGGSTAQYNAAAYCIAKAGLDSLARSIALEWSQYGIRSVGLAPGDIGTETSNVHVAAIRAGELQSNPYARITPLGRKGTAEEMAGVVSFIVSEDASFVTGTTVRADGGFLAY